MLKIGTCSWKYPSWAGLVYSAPNKINYLAEYSKQYDTVEVDQWFWSLFDKGAVKLPDTRTVEEYARSVGEHFSFGIKMPNSLSLTHYYRKSKSLPLVENPHFFSTELLEKVLHSLSPLKNQPGPLMFQFEYLNKQMRNSKNVFFEELKQFSTHLPEEYTFGIEIRNQNYLSKSYFETLLKCNLTPVLLEGYWMPPVTSLYAQYRDLLTQFKTITIRLHGTDREAIETQTGKVWNSIVIDRSQELNSIALMGKELEKQGIAVYFYVNNHYEGCAPKTIDRLKTYL